MHWLISTIEYYHLIEIIVLLGGITAVWMLVIPFRLPALRPIDTGATPYDQELASLKFTRIGCYDATMHPTVGCIFYAYSSEDGRHHAGLIEMTTTYGKKSVMEFSTRLDPKGSITTNNSRDPQIFYRPPEKICVSAHWKKDFTGLFQLHSMLCDAAAKSDFTPRKTDSGDFIVKLAEWLREDFENQVRVGRMRRTGHDSYRFTLKGAILAVPRVWSFMTYGLILRLLRPGDNALQNRVLRRFARIRRESYIS